MAEFKKNIVAGPLVVEVIYPAPNPRDSVGVRAGKKALSSEAQQKMNLKYAFQKLELEIAANFGAKDLYATYGKYKHPYCRNANSIGIEICCRQRKDGTWYFDPETIGRAVELGRELMAQYGIDADHVLRHYDVTGKICPVPFVLDENAWKKFKKRLVEKDMTKEETQALIDAAVKDAKPKVYAALPEVPKWAQGLVERAMSEGAIKGDGAGKLRLTDDNLVNLQMLYNMADRKGSV